VARHPVSVPRPGQGPSRSSSGVLPPGSLSGSTTLPLAAPGVHGVQVPFGNERFDFDGNGWDLFRGFVLSILLTLPTLGICWIWYLARKRRFFWDHTGFGEARFRSTVSGGALLGLYLVNALLLVCTLGIAWPWVRVRNINFAYRYLALEGPLDLERIQQEAQFASATGEGLAGFLDTGFDLG
jgi:uncharacterized membrane protein YjgN (DUF898 family)